MPRLAFINKLDRQGSNPDKVIKVSHTRPAVKAAGGGHCFALPTLRRPVSKAKMLSSIVSPHCVFRAQDLRSKLRLNAAAMQVPIGLEGGHEGVINVVSRTAFFFKGVKGEVIEEGPIPANLLEKVEQTRQELIENLADVDEEVSRNTQH